MKEALTRFIAARHLDPATRMGEILFGLIMTLTFTLGASMIVTQQGREGAREMLIATLGCNAAWGLIDGIFYILGQLFERSRLHRVGDRVKHANTPEAARALVADELDDLLANVVIEADRAAMYDSIAARLRREPLPRNRVTKEDLAGGLWAGVLVFACSLPVALPFLLISDPHAALRVSNALLLVLLFLAGYRFAKDTMAYPWLTGVVFLIFGLVLVLINIVLGG